MKLSDYDIPETTTLLLIGPKGCGKSSLVNRISRVLEDDKFAPERAQVSCNVVSFGCFEFMENHFFRPSIVVIIFIILNPKLVFV